LDWTQQSASQLTFSAKQRGVDMRDYSLTITDKDNDAIEFTHDTDDPGNMLVEVRRFIKEEMRTVSVSLTKKDALAVRRFLDVFINEEDKNYDF